MPKIPVYKRQVSIPGGGASAFGDVHSAGMVGDAISRAGDQLLESATRMQEEKDRIDTINHSTEISKLIQDYEIEKKSSEQGELAYGIKKRSETNLDSIVNDYVEKNVPERLRGRVSLVGRQHIDNSLDRLTTYELGQREVYRQQSIKNTVELAGNQIASHADSSVDIKNTLAETIAKLDALNTPQYEIDKISSGLISVAIEANANNGNYKEAESLIEENKTILDAHGVRDTLLNVIKTKKKQAEILAKEAQEEAVNATNKAFQDKYLDGNLNATDVLNSNLDENGKKSWIDQLKDLPTSTKTDPDFYSDLWDKIQSNPESITDREIMAFMGHGLSKTDAKGLIAERKQALNGDPERQEAIKDVLNELRIDKAEKVFSSSEYLKQVETFKKWVKAHPNDPPSAYRERVLAPRAMSNIQKVLDWVPGINPGEADPKKTREDIEAELLKETPAKPITFKQALNNAFGADQAKANAVMMAESSGNPKAINKNDNGTTDYGLFQINSIWIPELKNKGIIKSANDLLNVGANVTAAKYIWEKAGRTFDRDWAASKGRWGQSGKKLIGYRGGKPVYDLGNGKWEVGA